MEEEETPAAERREVLTGEKERMDVEEEGESEKPSKEEREEEGGEEETGESLQETLVTKKVFSATTRSTIVEETLEETEKAKEDEEGGEEDEAQAKKVLGSWEAEVSLTFKTQHKREKSLFSSINPKNNQIRNQRKEIHDSKICGFLKLLDLCGKHSSALCSCEKTANSFVIF